MDLHVSLVSLWYPPYTSGGVGTQTFDLVHSLARLGVHVTVFCGGFSQSHVEESHENLEIIRLPTIEVPPRFLWFQLKNNGVLGRKLATTDLIHSQATAFSLHALARKSARKPWVVSFHGSPSRDTSVLLATSPLKWNLDDVTTHLIAFPVWASFNYLELKYASNYVFCGQSAAQDVIDFFRCDQSKVNVIPNGIDFLKIERILSNSPASIENENLTLFYCGRLFWRKGIEYLVRAMPNVIKEHKKVVLKIFGKGPLKGEILKLISTLNLEENVRLMGYAPYADLLRELSASDIAVFPSLYEGLSVAMLEAMACSKPTVTFDYPFTREIIKHMDNGVLVPPKNTLELAETLTYLLSDAKMRKKIGAKAYEYVRKNHDWAFLAKRYLKVYGDTVGAA